MEGDLLAYIRKHVNVDNLHHLLADLGLLPASLVASAYSSFNC